MANFTEMVGTSMEARNRARAKIIERAVRELKLPRGDVTVRELRPEDLGLSPTNRGEWTFSLSSGTNEVVNTTMADSRFVTLYGARIGQSSAQVSIQIRVDRENQTKRFWNIQGMNLTRDSSLYFDDPLTIPQNTNITINVSANATNSAEKLVLFGDVAEKRGMLTA